MFLGRKVAPGEPLWLEEDTLAVLAYLREKALACSGCGLPRDETMNPESERRYHSQPVRCHACRTRAGAHRRFVRRDHPEDEDGLYFSVESED